MDRGLIVLMAFAGLLILSLILNAVDVLSTGWVHTTIMISLIYHTCYTIFTIVKWNKRPRIRNARRCNHRPPKRDSAYFK